MSIYTSEIQRLHKDVRVHAKLTANCTRMQRQPFRQHFRQVSIIKIFPIIKNVPSM